MAKEKAAPAEKAKRQPPVRELPKYNINNLTSDLGLEPASIRVLLRKSDLTKNGGAWGWDTKAEYDSALKALKALQSKPKADKPAKEEKASKPAKAEKAPKKSDK